MTSGDNCTHTELLHPTQTSIRPPAIKRLGIDSIAMSDRGSTPGLRLTVVDNQPDTGEMKTVRGENRAVHYLQTESVASDNVLFF